MQSTSILMQVPNGNGLCTNTYMVKLNSSDSHCLGHRITLKQWSSEPNMPRTSKCTEHDNDANATISNAAAAESIKSALIVSLKMPYTPPAQGGTKTCCRLCWAYDDRATLNSAVSGSHVRDYAVHHAARLRCCQLVILYQHHPCRVKYCMPFHTCCKHSLWQHSHAWDIDSGGKLARLARQHVSINAVQQDAAHTILMQSSPLQQGLLFIHEQQPEAQSLQLNASQMMGMPTLEWKIKLAFCQHHALQRNTHVTTG